MITLLAQITESTPAATWSEELLIWAVEIGLASVAISMVLCISRLVRGPHLADRALAADTLAIELIGFVVLLMVRLKSGVFIDSVLVLSLLSFAGTVAMAQYIGRNHFQRIGADAHDDKRLTDPPTDSETN